MHVHTIDSNECLCVQPIVKCSVVTGCCHLRLVAILSIVPHRYFVVSVHLKRKLKHAEKADLELVAF